jgi:hypothetical protein
MKRFSKFLAVAALTSGMGLSSCEGVLNILPPLDLANESALTNTRGLETALTGAYNGLASGSLVAGNCITTGEIWSDQIIAASPGFGELQIVGRNLNFFNPNGRSIWQDGYGVINRANNILDALPTVNDAQIAGARDAIRGESLFLRGWMYFELVRYFSQAWGFTADNTHPGVVLRTTPTKGSTGLPKARSTVAETYKQIIDDLTEAERLLPTTNPNGRADKAAVAALLARVYFQQNDFTNAASAANRVISTGRYALNASVRGVFDANDTPEAIFQLRSTDQNNSAGAVQGSFRAFDFDSPFYLDDAFARTLTTAANRGDRRIDSLHLQRDGITFTTKYDRLAPPMHVPLIRYSEMLLIRAEATAQSAPAAALADVNAVRTRAGLTALTGLSGQALTDAIRRERSIEFIAEGFRYHELKRTRQNLRSTPWNGNQTIFKIPDVEVNANTLCTQNPD